jgi:transmembrane sensor
MDDNEHIILEQLINDDHFLKWVLDNTPQQEAYWQKWMQANTEHQETILKAKKMVETLYMDFSQKRYDEDIKLEIYHSIQHNIQKLQLEYKRKKVRNLRNRYLLVAAVVLPLLIFSWIFLAHRLLQNSNEQIFNTKYAEIKTIVLPDGSEVILNANSQLSYQLPWKDDEQRIVKLKGEAFFKVQKSPQVGRRKFIVQTQDLLIEVLGTQFNVNSRLTGTKVILTEGRVKVQTPTQQQTVLEKPGDLVEWSSTTQKLDKKVAEENKYISWKDKKWVFDRTPFGEVFGILSDHYGYKIQVTDSSILKKEFVGTYPTEDVELLIFTLSKYLDIKQSENTLVIGGYLNE